MQAHADSKQLRSFGLLVGGIFAAIGLFPLLQRGGLRLWAILAAVLLIIPALVMPRILAPVHRIWMAIGNFLGHVNTILILGLLFYAVFTPLGLAMRLLGKDPMRQRFDSQADTYRLARSPRAATHMLRHF